MSLYKDYLKMIDDAASFMKVHKVRMSGEDIKAGTVALVITQEALDNFGKKLQNARLNIEPFDEKKEELKKNALDALYASSSFDNPFNVPEQESESDTDAFYFPLGRG